MSASPQLIVKSNNVVSRCDVSSLSQPTLSAAALLEAVDKVDTAVVNRLLHAAGILVNACNKAREDEAKYSLRM